MDEKDIKKLVSDTVSSVVEDKLSKLNDTVTKAVTDAVKVQAEEAKKLADEAEAKAKKEAEEKAEKEKGAKLDSARVALHAKLLPLLGKDYDGEKTDAELVQLALKDTVKDADKKSAEYLVDKLDELIESRKDAINFSDEKITDAPVIVMATRR